MRVKVYVEGGGDSKPQKSRLRRGLREFLEKAGLRGRMPAIVACGGRDSALDRFSIGGLDRTIVAILLVDSEEPVVANRPWQHLKSRDGWDRPSGAQDDQCHLMVQSMESWLIVDRDALTAYYGAGFKSNTIPIWQDIERVPRADVEKHLIRATRHTTKGQYHKGSHTGEILRILDPTKVMKASPHAKRFVDCLRTLDSCS